MLTPAFLKKLLSRLSVMLCVWVCGCMLLQLAGSPSIVGRRAPSAHHLFASSAGALGKILGHRLRLPGPEDVFHPPGVSCLSHWASVSELLLLFSLSVALAAAVVHGVAVVALAAAFAFTVPVARCYRCRLYRCCSRWRCRGAVLTLPCFTSASQFSCVQCARSNCLASIPIDAWYTEVHFLAWP